MYTWKRNAFCCCCWSGEWRTKTESFHHERISEIVCILQTHLWCRALRGEKIRFLCNWILCLTWNNSNGHFSSNLRYQSQLEEKREERMLLIIIKISKAWRARGILILLKPIRRSKKHRSYSQFNFEIFNQQLLSGLDTPINTRNERERFTYQYRDLHEMRLN